MKDIIERLKKATGPDRQLDNDIEAAISLPKPTNPDDLPGYPPRFTAVFEDAKTLVPEGFNGSVAFGRHCGAILWRDHPRNHLGDHRGATPAIALCIAALTALTLREKLAP